MRIKGVKTELRIVSRNMAYFMCYESYNLWSSQGPPASVGVRDQVQNIHPSSFLAVSEAGCVEKLWENVGCSWELWSRIDKKLRGWEDRWA